MLTFKIIATVAFVVLHVYYFRRLWRFYNEAADYLGKIDIGLDEKMHIYRKYVSFKGPILDTAVGLSGVSLLVFWIFG